MFGNQEKVDKLLSKSSAEYCLCHTLDAVAIAKEHGKKVIASPSLNVMNSLSMDVAKSLGIDKVIISNECTLEKFGKVSSSTPIGLTVYGRIPLMLLEKCVASEVSSCDHCTKAIANITDRRGISFPILREFEHRNVIYNSAPTYMADKESELSRAGITNRHFVFSTETQNEVDYIISCHKNQSSAKENQKIRRI
jgi:putative protease